MSAFFSWLGGLVLDYLWGKLAALFKQQVEDDKSHADVQREAEASVLPLKNAQTEKEIDDATDPALNGL